ncbi:Peptidase family M23 [Neomoorella glycerini]|uniref:Peptidase family M23 n=1 Tax=Neomoorella glycerini TaxID=55779 RepID=A0A6I5ZPE3_9FIRM|nr:M23 family metallopeptidase [Moorella glycerini]QGP91802.1 Peptidase family M23 [Moorella glycerini]
MPPPGKLPDVAAAAGRFLKKWPARWKETDGRKKKKFYLLSGILAGGLLLLAGWYQFTAPNAWAVIINGRQVAVVTSRVDVNQVIQDVLKERGAGSYQGLQITDQVDYKKVRVNPREIVDGQQLKNILQGTLHFVAAATVITINGQPELIVRDDSIAEAVLAELKQAYLPLPGNGEIQEVRFLEQVAYEHRPARPEEILSPEAALARLKGTSPASQEYIVKEGDSLWTIAREHGLLVDDIRAANPEIKGERLDIGQRLRLTTEKPLLQVMVVYSQEVQEPVPYDVKVETNTDLLRGQERVKQAGSEGQRLVTYQVVTKNGVQVEKKVIQEQVLKEPVTKIVERGTRVVLASRGGSGRLAWPIRGSITSPYGYRGREFHSGMDIDGYVGQPVGAAEAGTVTFAGYDGGYGRMIAIDHGGGLVTRYAHLSGFNVRVGQQVSRGQVIGYVGVSGRTTGSHLHFEVLVNGSFRNPYGFLN